MKIVLSKFFFYPQQTVFMSSSLKFFAIMTLLLLQAVAGWGQQEGDDTKAGRVSPKEFTIPPSPVFDLMGVTPSQVTRTSDIKDFKVDWSFKSWRLNPNLAIESQPVWEMFYNRKELTKYQHASPFMRKLASVDFSIGTVQNEDNDRRIGFATKINLIKQKDPLLASELYEDISQRSRDEKTQLEEQLKALQTKLDTTQNVLLRPGIRDEIRSTQDQLATIISRRNQEINSRAKIFVAEHWNASSLDLAYGKIYTYQTDSAGSLTKLRLNRNTGWGVWLNGGLGMGPKLLLTGLIRTTWYQEELNFLVRNKNTGEEQNQKAVADNRLYTVGLNLRYGSAVYNFFVEFFYEKKSLKTPLAALNDVFKVPDDQLEVVGSSVKWSIVHPSTISFGGDWRMSRNVILNYGMRCVFDANWKFQTFTPVASISCMMR
jgi:hypothetical protein